MIIFCHIIPLCIGYTLKKMENLSSRANSVLGTDLDRYVSDCK